MEQGVRFSNDAVEQLPKLEAQHLLAVSPRYRVVNLLITVVTTLVLLAVITVIRFQSYFPIDTPLVAAYPFIVGVIVVLSMWRFIYHVFADVRVKYGVREQDISLQKGLIFRSLACQPILRVQHVELKRGPFSRMAGLSALRVFSAGGAMHTFEIPGLELHVAQQLRQFILDHKDLSAK